MLKIVTATYADQATISNVVDELINAGIPREKIYDDGAPLQVKVMVPATGVEGLKKILNRHEPTSVS